MTMEYCAKNTLATFHTLLTTTFTIIEQVLIKVD